MRERRADGDPLLLPAGQLRRMRAAPLEQAHALEELVGATIARSARLAAQRERGRDQVVSGQLRRQHQAVVLVGVAERSRAVGGELPCRQLREVAAERADDAR